jgi:hypothetical protein
VAIANHKGEATVATCTSKTCSHCKNILVNRTLAFGGSHDQHNTRNFLAYVGMIAEFDPIMQDHLKQIQNDEFEPDDLFLDLRLLQMTLPESEVPMHAMEIFEFIGILYVGGDELLYDLAQYDY